MSTYVDEFTLLYWIKAWKLSKQLVWQRSHLSQNVAKLGTNSKLAFLDFFKTCWTKSIWSWGTSKIIFVKKTDKGANDIAHCIKLPTHTNKKPFCEIFRKNDRATTAHLPWGRKYQRRTRKKGFKAERTHLEPSTGSIANANGQKHMQNMQHFYT